MHRSEQEPAYRCCEVERFPLGGEHELVHSRYTRGARVLPRFVAEALSGCTRFQPLATHAAQQARRLGLEGKRAEGLLTELSTLARDGFLVAADELRQGAPEAPVSLPVVGVPTRNRPATTRATLRSILENARRAGRDPELVVLDGSEAPAVREEYRRMLRELAREEGARVLYAGQEEREAFVERLARQGVDAEVAAFSLWDSERSGVVYGTNRNALLLHAAGRMVLSLDDDVLCLPAAAPGRQEGLSLFAGAGEGYENYQPNELWFFASREEALRSVEPDAGVDVLGLHEAVLGRSARGCIADVPPGAELSLDDCQDAALLRRLRQGAGRVRVSFQGLVGDIGWYAPTWYLLLTGASRERLVGSEADYLRACSSSREVLRVVRRTMLTDGRFCQGAVMGLDAREALPPFFPVGRYEDGVFRMSLRAVDEEALFAHLPWALPHLPPEARQFVREDIWRTASWVRTGELLVQCIRACPPRREATPAARLAALGGHLRALGALSLEGFEEFALQRFWYQKGLYVAHLEALLERYGGQPHWWAEDVRRHITALREAAAQPGYVVPRDLVQPGREGRAALALAQRLVGLFGRLLEAWPELERTARQLRQAGEGLAVAPFTPAPRAARPP